MQLQDKHKFVLLGGPEDTFLDELRQVAPERILNLAGKDQPSRKCGSDPAGKGACSNDTGLLHVGEQLGLPTVALMGPAPFGFTLQTQHADFTARPCLSPLQQARPGPLREPRIPKVLGRHYSRRSRASFRKDFAMMDIFVFLLYRWALLPIVFFVLKIFRPLLPRRFNRCLPTEPRLSTVLWARPIWIHAASGEVEYAKPVIRELKEQFPEIPILMTYFSPSAVKLLQKVEGLDFAVPLPFDQATKIRAFIHYCQPLAVLFARTDVWPELALQLRQKNIPTLLFSATLADNSSRTRGLSRFLSRFALISSLKSPA